MNNLFIITARSGSKGIAKKNIREVANISLIGFKAISARKSNYCTRIIISTDSKEFANNAKEYNIDVPFIRPDYLATDEASSIDVIIHAMEWVEENDDVKYDNIVLMEPSSPFATYNHINEAMKMFVDKKALTVLGVKETEVNSAYIAPLDSDNNMKNHYEKIKKINKFRRQDFVKEYTMNGAIYIAKWDYFKKSKSFFSNETYGYIMPKNYSVEIDEIEDLHYANFLVKNNLIDLNYWK